MIRKLFWRGVSCGPQTFSRGVSCGPQIFSREVSCGPHFFSREVSCGSQVFSREVSCGPHAKGIMWSAVCEPHDVSRMRRGGGFAKTQRRISKLVRK